MMISFFFSTIEKWLRRRKKADTRDLFRGQASVSVPVDTILLFFEDW